MASLLQQMSETAAAPPPPLAAPKRGAVAVVMDSPIDWLIAMMLSWIIPLELLGFRVTYFTSLVFFVVPIVLLLPRLYHETDRGGRRRRAFWYTTAFIVVAGCALDFGLGGYILNFSPNNCTYVWRFPFGQHIPLEEVLFYITGGMAVVLVYFWADEYWMKAYNARQHRNNSELVLPSGEPFRLFRFSPGVLACAVGLLLFGVFMKWRLGFGAWPPPYYFTFLVLVSVVPAIAIYRNVKEVVNWRAFSFTCLYMLVTSCIWEVTLGIAREWWWYKVPPAVMGWHANPFGSLPDRPYPVEALLVWLVVSFDAIFAFEFAKGITHEPGGAKKAMFG
jgi:hypothetical protein